MSFSPTTSTCSSSSGSSYDPTRIEVDLPSLVLWTNGTLRSPARRRTILHHESGGSIEGTHQMLDQAERRRVNVLALVESALAIVDSSNQHEDGHHHHYHSNRREQEQQQATRAGRNAAAAAAAGSSNEEEDYSSSSRTTVLSAAGARTSSRQAPQRLPHSSPNRGPTN